MYSQCPDCQTRFRVTAEMLRAARGTVRCGRCGGAFDALERLSDTVPPPGPESVHARSEAATDAPSSGSAANVEYHFSLEDLEQVFVEASDWRDPFTSAEVLRGISSEPAGVGAEPPLVVVQESPGIEDITLEGERVSIEAPPEDAPREVDLDSTDELEILHYVPDSAYPEDDDEEAQAAEPAVEPLARADDAPIEAAPPVAFEAAAEPAESAEPAETIVAAAAPASTDGHVPLSAQRWRRPLEEEEREPEPGRPTSAWSTLAWTAGSLALALVLAAQVTHHFRQDLVRHPQIGPPLRMAYERLGLELAPNWNLAAFELRQWGNAAQAAAQGRMAVRASLTNRAAFAQPHPILRLELEDRFGNTVATRDFEPADYLKNPSQASRLVAPGASSEAELLLADPSADAVGYRLDVCLRESATLLRCARGPG